MHSSDFLHSLVRSLTAAEKKHFLGFALISVEADSPVLRLFDLLGNLPEYDSRLLKKEISDLYKTKHLLRKLILDSLRSFPSGDDPEIQIYRLQQDYRNLYKRGFYQEASRHLEKARQLAQKYHCSAMTIQVLNQEKHRLLENNTTDLIGPIREKIEETNAAMSLYQEELRFSNCYHLLFAWYRTNGSDSHQDHLQELCAGIEEADPPDENSSFYARLYHGAALALTARMNQQQDLFCERLGKVLELWDGHPHLKKAFPGRYKILLANYATILVVTGQHERARDMLRQIHAAHPSTFNDEAETFQNVAQLELLLILNSSPLSVPAGTIERISEGLDRYGAKINMARKKAIWFNLVLVFLFVGDYLACRSWLDKLLAEKKYPIRQELYYESRFIELILHYELGYLDLLEGGCVALYNYLWRHEQLNDFNQVALKYLKQLTAVHDYERAEVMADFRAAIALVAGGEGAYGSVVRWVG
jgi:tetratricopeptide (TPR) repeat protein